MLRKDLLALAGVLVVAGLMFFVNLGGPALWDRDEPRNAQCAREMLQRNDWVVPFFNDELRDHKPVLLYWCMLASYTLFGVNEFAARAPSAACSVLSVLLTFFIARRIWGLSAAVWSAICLSSCFLFALVSRAATPDALLICCSTLSITMFVYFSPDFRATPGDHNPFPQSWWQAALIYSAMAMGVLAKGPVGLILPTAVIGMYCLVRRLPTSTAQLHRTALDRAKLLLRCFHPLHFLKTCWSMRPLTALGMVLLLAAPWYVWVGLRTDGLWLAGFFGTHNLSRAMETMEGHAGGWWFYPAVLLAGTFPWSILTIPLVAFVWRGYRDVHPDNANPANRGLLLMSCWVCVFVGCFTLAATKLPNYVAPCYPAVAMLVGVLIVARCGEVAAIASRWIHGGLSTQLLAGLAISVGLFLALQDALPGLEWLCLVGAIPIVGALLGWLAFRSADFRNFAGALSATAALFTAALVIVAAGQVSTRQQIDDLLAGVPGISESRSRAPLVSLGLVEPSWVFYAQRPILELSPRDTPQLTALLAEHGPLTILTTRDKWKTLATAHTDVTVVGSAELFLESGTVTAVVARPLNIAKSGSATDAPR